MKSIKLLLPLAAAAAAIFLGGCATPASRIRQYPELFASYPADQQEVIKQGKIAVGFDQNEVRLALGEPDIVRSHVSADGRSETWSYVTYDMPDGMPLYRGWYHRYYGGIYPWYMDYPGRVEREHLRVVFDRQGRVTTVDQQER